MRMGIATGPLLPGQDIKNSAVVDLAKAVSDMGCGGQVLMDERTFLDVKERLRELGAVDAAGINWKKLTSGRMLWGRLKRRCAYLAAAVTCGLFSAFDSSLRTPFHTPEQVISTPCHACTCGTPSRAAPIVL